MKKLITLLFVTLFAGLNWCFTQSNIIEEISTIVDNPTVFGIGLKDNYLFVNPGSSVIKIYDLSTPENPTSVGQITYSSDFATNLDVSGNYLYVYGGPQNNLIIFDITNPTSPIELGILQLPPSNTGIWHSGHLPNYTYMTAKDTVYIINTEDKNTPFIENKIPFSGAGVYGLRDIFVTTEFLYIGIENGVLIYDNSNQALPTFQSIYPNGRLRLAVDITGNMLYTAQEWSSNYTHYISDISDPFNPNLVSQGAGGSSPGGKLLYNDEILIQTGADTGNQAVSFYKIQDDTTVYLLDFLGSINFSITDMDAVDDLYIISKNGGIEILRYNDNSTTTVYHPFPESNAIWIGTDMSFDGIDCLIYDDYNLFISGDTTIGALNYHKLYKNGFTYSNCPPPGYFYYNQYYGAFRQDSINRKVFLNFNGIDTLAYDFNLNVGDTIPPTYLNWYTSYNYVESIDSVIVLNEYRKRYWISNEYSSPNYMALIEGIGSDHGAFAQFIENWGEASSELWCVYKEDEIMWQLDPTGFGCNLITSVNEQLLINEISVYPNPIKSSAIIKIPGNCSNITISMYNSFGKKVKEIRNPDSNTIRLDRKNLSSGLYFIQVLQHNKLVSTKKIMISN